MGDEQPLQESPHSAMSLASPRAAVIPVSLLRHKVAELRAALAEDERVLARLRSKLQALEARKAPLLLSLSAALSGQQKSLDALRLRLQAVHASFGVEQREAHALYEAALSDMDAAFERSLANVATDARALMEQQSAVDGFASAEAALQRKRDDLRAANDAAEQRHAQRMRDMEQRWESSRQAVHAHSADARRLSELRYKERLMRLMRVSYQPVTEELRAMEAAARAEDAVRTQLQTELARCRAAVDEERARCAEDGAHRRGGTEALLELRLAIKAAECEAANERSTVERWRAGGGEARRRARAALRRRSAQVDAERSAWGRALTVQRREAARLSKAVGRVERLRTANPFHALSAECVRHVRQSGEPWSRAQRLAVLRLLFARLRDAERKRDRAVRSGRNGRRVEDSQATSNAAARAESDMDARGPVSSFFLTQPTCDS